MPTPRHRATRSTTLLSGSSYSKRPAVELCLRRSLTGHCTLIEPITHKTRYHVQDAHGHPTREIRRDSSDGQLVSTVQQKASSSRCQLTFFDGTPNIEIGVPRKLSFRGRHRFEVNGLKLYWKRDQVCRHAPTRRVYADTDGDTLMVYEGAEEFLDVIVASFLAMKFKHQTCGEGGSWFKVLSSH
jgi:hypothetical protein